MGHRLVLVLVANPRSDVEAQVEAAIGRYAESDDDNPDSKYDWYTFGGRWNGIFAGKFVGASAEKDGAGGRVEGNVCPVAELPADLEPAVIATPDGAWHYYGWRPPGDSGPLPPPMNEVLGQYRDHYAVAVDAHA